MTVMITFDELARETAWLSRLARSLTRNDADAADLVHETFVTAAEKGPADGRPLRPWLARVLVNHVRMWSRGGTRRRRREESVGALAAASSPATPDALVARLEIHRKLAGYVLDLPASQRDVVLLHYVEGLTSVAIGNRLGISDGTVRWRLKQAVDDLRMRLDKDDPDRAWVGVVLGFTTPHKAMGSGVIAGAILLAIAACVLVWVTHSSSAMDSREASAASSTTTDHTLASPIDPINGAASTDPTSAGTHAGSLAPSLGRVTGIVLDERGAPVPGADVSLQCPIMAGINPAPTITAADGTFTLEPGPGAYCLLHAEKRGAIAELPVWADETERLSLQLYTPPTATLHVVDDATGEPISGAAIQTFSVYAFGPTGVATDDTGTARMPWYSAFVVDAPEYAHALVELSDGLRRYPPENPTHLEETVRLVRGLSMRGIVVGPDNARVANAKIHVSLDLPALSNAAGEFEVRVQKPGRYVAYAETATLQSAALPLVLDGSRSDIVLRAEPRGSVTGTVVDSNNRPVADARVFVDHGARAPTYTDAAGHFELLAADGITGLIAAHGDRTSPWREVHVDRRRVEVHLQLGPSGITGVVVDPQGEPVAGADVWLNYVNDSRGSALTSGRHAEADASGRFSLDTPSGVFRLSVRRDGDYDFDDRDDVIVNGGSRDIRLVVP